MKIRRRSKVVAGLVALAMAALMVNAWRSRAYGEHHEAAMDMLSTVHFLAAYAAEHDDRLPDSIEDLNNKGYIVPDTKAPARFAKYYQNPIHRPERLRWKSGACLRDFEVSDNGVVSLKSGKTVRLVWIEGADPSVVSEDDRVRLMFRIWRGYKDESRESDRIGAPVGRVIDPT